MNKAVKTIIGLTLFSIIVLFFIWLEISQTDTRQPRGIVNIPNPIGYNLDISLELSSDQFDFPESVKQINVSNLEPTSREKAESFAKQIGFEGAPRIVNDISYGTTYRWSDRNSSFLVYSKAQKGIYSVYNFENTQITQDLSLERVRAIAERFLYDNNFFNREELEFVSIEHYDAGHEDLRMTTPDKANLIQVNFIPATQEGLSIVSLSPEFSPIEIWITNNGEVTRAIIHFLDFIITETNVRLINYNELSNRLNQAILIDVDEGNMPVPTLEKADIGKITVSEIKFAYFYQYPKDDVLTPVFVLKGQGVIFDQELPVTLYLPAEK